MEPQADVNLVGGAGGEGWGALGEAGWGEGEGRRESLGG